MKNLILLLAGLFILNLTAHSLETLGLQNFKSVPSNETEMVESVTAKEVTAGQLSTVLTAEQLASITSLTLTGTIDARDFKTMRDEMPLLAIIDLSGVNVAEYYGVEGTDGTENTKYFKNEIPNNALKSKASLSIFKFPESVTSIGYFAFSNCSALKHITIPNKVETVKMYSFEGCSSTNTINIPPSLLSIEPYAFNWTSGEVIVDTNNPNYSSLDGVLFNKDHTSLIQFPTSKLGAYLMPNTINHISIRAFAACKISTISFSSNLESTGYSAFAFSDSLKKLTISPTIKHIDNESFYFCKNLEEVTLSEGIISIGERAFNWCFSLKSITIPKSVNKISNYAFQGCQMLSSITALSKIPVDISNSPNVFEFVNKIGCTLYVPHGSKTAYQAADLWKDFQNIVEMEPSYEMPLQVEAGGLAALIPQSVRDTITYLALTGTIDARDFKTMRDDMPLLAEIDLSGASIVAYSGTEGTSLYGEENYPPDAIPAMAFVNSSWQGKHSLKSIIFPVATKIISNSAFFDCRGLTMVSLPHGLQKIDGQAFVYCRGLENINIPSTVTSIGTWAFGSCTSLTNITIPASVVLIENNVFGGCEQLADISVDADNEYYASEHGVLFNKSKTTLLQYPAGKTGFYTVPSSITSINNVAFVTCIGLEKIILPKGLIFIGSYAFSGCSNLNSITAKNPVPVDLVTSPGVFDGIDISTCILYVPFGSKVAYQAANQWQDFKNIIEMNSDIPIQYAVYDIDGNGYDTVRIGNQTWLKQNLYVTKFNDGSEIPNVTDGTDWSNLETPAYSWYNNDSNYGPTYGAYYNWYVVDSLSNGGKNVCPTGWRIPSLIEWHELANYLGGRDVAGGKMKVTGTDYWLEPNEGATNESGFSAVGAASRIAAFNGGYSSLNGETYFWNKEEASNTNAYQQWIFSSLPWLQWQNNSKKNGISCRCIKDNSIALTFVPDDNFEQALIELGYDSGALDDYVPTANISGLTSLDVSNKGISDLTGIQDFISLQSLNCGINSLTTIDLSKNLSLTVVLFYNNQLASLDVSQNSLLQQIYGNNNYITSLNLSQNPDLNTLDFGNNKLTSIDLSNNPLLFILNCSYNQIPSIDLSNNTNLVQIGVSGNPISTLDISNNKNLKWFYVSSTNLTEIDCSQHSALETIDCSDNKLLTSLNLQNGNNAILRVFAAINPNLFCIQVDDPALAATYSNWSKDAQASYSSNCSPLPVANAGNNQTVFEGDLVTLDGSGSSDAENRTLTFKWTAPEGIVLNSENIPNPTFIAPDVSSDQPFAFTLVVNNGILASEPSKVEILVKNISDPVVTYPSDADIVLNNGQTYNITWSKFPGSRVKIELLKENAVTATISASTPNDDSHFWTIPAGIEPDDDFRIMITSLEDISVSDISDNFFTIKSLANPLVLVPSEPGIIWNNSQTYNITWSGFTGSKVRIELIKDNTVRSTIAASTANDGTHPWTIAKNLESGTDYKIRVTSVENKSVTNISDNFFTIQPGTDKPGKKSAEIDKTQFANQEKSLLVYPNPFTDKVNFEIMLKEPAMVVLEIFNITGQKLATLFDGKVEADVQTRFEYKPEKIQAQILLYKLRIDDEVKTGKLIYKP